MLQKSRPSRHTRKGIAYPYLLARTIVKLLELMQPFQISDKKLVLGDIVAKSKIQVATFVAEVLFDYLLRENAGAFAFALSEGRWTHDFLITAGSEGAPSRASL